MRHDYYHGYRDMDKFTKKVDRLGERQRKIHGKLLHIENICDNNIKEFQRRFGPLRVKTFKNLKSGEKLIVKDKRLKSQFAKRVCIYKFVFIIFFSKQIYIIIILFFFSDFFRYTILITKMYKNVRNVSTS